jgi:hypothetical protein
MAVAVHPRVSLATAEKVTADFKAPQLKKLLAKPGLNQSLRLGTSSLSSGIITKTNLEEAGLVMEIVSRQALLFQGLCETNRVVCIREGPNLNRVSHAGHFFAG